MSNDLGSWIAGTLFKTHEGALYAWESRQRAQPRDVSAWERIGPQQGSNPGGTFRDPEGREYYVKFPQTSSEQVRSEQLANSIYRALDVPVPRTEIITNADGATGLASRIIPGATGLGSAAIASSADVRRGFVADAYLANHDVVGLGYDNILHGDDGRDYRVDNGGSMFFRAQGAPKDFSASSVPQIDSMRDPYVAHEAGRVFQHLTDAQLVPQARQLVQTLSDERIDRLVSEAGLGSRYRDALIGRHNALARRFGGSL